MRTLRATLRERTEVQTRMENVAWIVTRILLYVQRQQMLAGNDFLTPMAYFSFRPIHSGHGTQDT
jgi:hypothetical protein